MINLGDYLGTLLSEITIARVQADLEAIRIAEHYANHELLKHFPIPRVRVREVNLDIPVVITNTESPPDKGSPRGGVLSEVLQERFLKNLQKQLDKHSIKIDDAEQGQLIQKIDNETERLVRPALVQIDTNLAADRYSAVVGRLLEKKKHEIGSNKLNTFLDILRRTSRSDFLNARLDIPRIQVVATSAEIGEAPAESVVRISLRVNEEGIEWTSSTSFVNGEEEVENRLIPE